MAESPETDHTISSDTDQNALDGSARPHCPPDHPAAIPTKSGDTDPDLSTMPKESVLFALAKLCECF
jgi:hypothetical protein